ncbi:MAG: ABC transporter ATP-binding protein [Thermoplasmata archaeon]
MLEINNLKAGYFGSTVIQDLSITCKDGITLVVGANGAGKSTLVKSINGTLRPIEGKIIFNNENIQTLNAHTIANLGIATVPERGRIFTNMTVKENLKVSFESSHKKKNDFLDVVEKVFAIFPDLKEKLNQKAGLLSGGQQQMLSIARALVSSPKFLIMDEPTTGLFPKVVKELITKIVQLSENMPILITEQNLVDIVPVAKKIYLIESGKIVFSGNPDEVMTNTLIKKLYFGYKEGK